MHELPGAACSERRSACLSAPDGVRYRIARNLQCLHAHLVTGVVPQPSTVTGPMPAMDVHAVLGILPHRYPFLLVDTVLEIERGTRIVAMKVVSANEPFFSGLTSRALAMPGLLIVEALAQAGAILLLAEQEAGSNRIAYFASLDHVEWPSPVAPGDRVRLEISVGKRRGRLNKVHGRATVGERVVCEADLGAVVVDG